PTPPIHDGRAGPPERRLTGPPTANALAVGTGRTGTLCTMEPLKVTYDEVADAAYIYLQAPGTRVARMYPCDPVDVDGMINLDFDANGRLIGLEVLDARAKLAPQLLTQAENITRRTTGGQ
ncbi:DUF2283 domain-containing protein, partial [Actinoplanes rectilineatus]|uniref:DUF2283 domain-containing protein n=1 Tax=Actinoplanes rectilineatus TaxID=113571 RepID=UPI000A47E63C